MVKKNTNYSINAKKDMSDTRFTLVGIVVIFAGFITFSIFSSEYFVPPIQNELDECFDSMDIPIACQALERDKALFMISIIGIISFGVFLIIKGMRGKWDQDVKEQDMLGPGHDKTQND